MVERIQQSGSCFPQGKDKRKGVRGEMRKFLKHNLFKKRVLILFLIQIILTLLFISCGSMPVITNAKVLPSGKIEYYDTLTISVRIDKTNVGGEPWLPYFMDGGFSVRLGLFDCIELGGALNVFPPGISADIKFALLKVEKNYFALDLYAKTTLSFSHYGGSLLYTYDFNDTSSLNCLVGAISIIEDFKDELTFIPDKANFIFGGIYYSWFNPVNNATLGLGIILIKEVTSYQSFYITPNVTFKFY